jgi:GalNAc-alpha-(1->4)-GalNAc-alpha-(1->3)-diNAcBac-PP-undecaprenol alpha-1,4-N-acetyl-D-galactosaminyltransferase
MSLKATKICLIIPSLGPGGMERVMSLLANYFSTEKGAEIHLILYAKKRNIFYEIDESVSIHRPDFEFRDRFRAYYTLKTLFFLRKKVKELSPDVILSFGEYWNQFVLLSNLGRNDRIYVADRAQPGLKRSYLYNRITKWLYKRAKGIIVQTKKAKKIYYKLYNHQNIAAIGNPIRDIENADEISDREKVILSVGRLVDTKHFDLLIRIFEKVQKKNWHLIIVGGDSQKQNEMMRLRGLIKEKNLEDSVELAGIVSNVDEYYRKSSIFAFTSSSEGFPNVIGEAMSAGLPVISFDCVAGPSDLIEDGKNGYLIPLFDENEYSKKLTSLMNDEYLRKIMGEHSKQRIQDYSTPSIGDEFLKFITSEL